MGTKVTSGKLNISVTESVTVNGIEHNYTNARSVSGINNVMHRIMRTPADGTRVILVSFDASAVALGQLVDGQAKYIRITNLDDTNLLRLNIRSTSKQMAFHLKAGETLIVNNEKLEAREDTGATLTFTDINNIGVIGRNAADGGDAAVDVEIFVASTQS